MLPNPIPTFPPLVILSMVLVAETLFPASGVPKEISKFAVSRSDNCQRSAVASTLLKWIPPYWVVNPTLPFAPVLRIAYSVEAPASTSIAADGEVVPIPNRLFVLSQYSSPLSWARLVEASTKRIEPDVPLPTASPMETPPPPPDAAIVMAPAALVIVILAPAVRVAASNTPEAVSPISN